MAARQRLYIVLNASRNIEVVQYVMRVTLDNSHVPEMDRWWLGRGGMPLEARPGGVLPCGCGGAVPWLLAADDGRRLPLPAGARPPPPPPRRGLLLTLGRPGVLSGLLAAVSVAAGMK